MSDSSLTHELDQVTDARVDYEATFAELTTLHLGGKPRFVVRCFSREAACRVFSLLDAHATDYLVLGGGSNLVVADGDLDLVVVSLECDQLDIDGVTGLVHVEAGAQWDSVVQATVAVGLGGLECLSGIPGSAGATPVQNVGAYGVEIADVLTRVELWDRATGSRVWEPVGALELAYRWSNLKYSSRAIVLSVEFQLRTDGLSAPLRYGELARRCGVTGSAPTRVMAAQAREHVLELRRSKGMVVDDADHDTWSAGSFFTNPVVDPMVADAARQAIREEYGEAEADSMPCFPVPGGKVKLSAAWLIERAGFPRGYPNADAPVRLSTKHTLALTNRGPGTGEQLVALAREIRDGVAEKFGVHLSPEPMWVGVKL